MSKRRRFNDQFGELVRRLTEGQSLRAVSRRTGVSHSYIDDMRWGIVPSRDVLEQVAEGLELEPEGVRELFEIAGYAPPVTALAPPEESGELVFYRGLFALQERYPERRLYLPRLQGGLQDLTPESAREILRDMEELLRETAEQEDDCREDNDTSKRT